MSFWDSILDAGTTIVGGILGGIGGSNKNDAKTTQEVTPWKPQQPYLIGGFQDAANIYNALKTQPYYQGSMYAGLSPLQQQSIAGTQGFATGGGTQTAFNLMGAGNASLGGAYGQMGVANDLSGFNPADPTQSNISAAGQYANNPYLDGAITAASRDVTRNLTEDVLPGINRMGSATGNTNSSRTGIAEGIALRGAQDRIGDIASTMRSDAYQQGLGLAENARTANMDARLNALTNAGSMYGNAFGQGIQGSTAGAQQMYNNLDALSQAGGMQQQDAQGRLNEQYAKWQGAQDRGFNLLDRYAQLIKGDYGYTNTGRSDNGMPDWLNAAQGAVGGAAAGLGLYNDFRNMFQQ